MSAEATRRSAIGISLAAIAAGIAAAPASAGTSPDAELIRLCAEAAACEARLRQIDQHGTSEENCTEANHAWDETFTKVIDTPASTISGIRAKANVLRLAIVRENSSLANWNMPLDDIPLHTQGKLDPALGMSLCRDILALGSVA